MPLIPVDTAVQLIVGPLIDDTDFKTLETAVAYNAAGMSVDLIKSSISGVPTKTDLTLTTAGAQDWVALGNGMYYVEITAAQNNVEGELQLVGVATGILPFISAKYQVVPAAVFNSLVLGTDNLQVDTIQIGGTTQTANDVGADVNEILTDTGTTLPATLATIDGIVDNILVDTAVIGAAGAGLTEAGGTGDHLTALATAAALATVDSEVGVIDGIVDQILADTNELQTDWANGGRLDNILDARASQSSVNTIDSEVGVIDGIVDQILADTNELQQDDYPARFAGIEGATFNTSTDSLEAIRNRGDAEWVTGSGSGLDAAGVRAAVGLASANLDTQLSTIDSEIGVIDGIVDDILVDTGTTLPATLTTIDNEIGAIDTVVDSILVDTGTTLPATLATIDGIVDDILVDTGTTLDGKLNTVDSVADAIKAKTDQLTFTVANRVDSNAKSMNDTALKGDGTASDKFRSTLVT